MRPRQFFGKVASFGRLVAAGQPKKAIRIAYLEMMRALFALLPHRGVDIVSEDWDVLIVLDACRYDSYVTENDFEGDLHQRTSKASSTSEWLQANFAGRYEDIVYVSANPRISDVEIDGFRGTDHFHEVVNVWQSDWDAEVNTVRPTAVTNAAIRARRQYPDKRIIVHYIQPHAPWIGETALSDRKTSLSDVTPRKWIEAGKTWGTMLNEGESTDVVKQAYRDNLRLVLDEVERLVRNIRGRIVVTSDHGECFGEKFIIEHPSGIYFSELVKVPWHVLEKSSLSNEDRAETGVVPESGECSERDLIRRSIEKLPKEEL